VAAVIRGDALERLPEFTGISRASCDRILETIQDWDLDITDEAQLEQRLVLEVNFPRMRDADIGSDADLQGMPALQNGLAAIRAYVDGLELRRDAAETAMSVGRQMLVVMLRMEQRSPGMLALWAGCELRTWENHAKVLRNGMRGLLAPGVPQAPIDVFARAQIQEPEQWNRLHAVLDGVVARTRQGAENLRRVGEIVLAAQILHGPTPKGVDLENVVNLKRRQCGIVIAKCQKLFA
jgi:hypothetical protein